MIFIQIFKYSVCACANFNFPIPNLLAKFHRAKISSFHFFNLMTLQEVETYTRNTPWQMKLIDDVNILIMWLCLKWFLVHKLYIRHVTKVIMSSIVSCCSKFQLHCICERLQWRWGVEARSKDFICKSTSTCKRLTLLLLIARMGLKMGGQVNYWNFINGWVGDEGVS